MGGKDNMRKLIYNLRFPSEQREMLVASYIEVRYEDCTLKLYKKISWWKKELIGIITYVDSWILTGEVD